MTKYSWAKQDIIHKWKNNNALNKSYIFFFYSHFPFLSKVLVKLSEMTAVTHTCTDRITLTFSLSVHSTWKQVSNIRGRSEN